MKLKIYFNPYKNGKLKKNPKEPLILEDVGGYEVFEN